MAFNTLVYLGHYEASFHRLHAHQDRYWKKGEASSEGRSVEEPPEKYVGGLRFGFMQTPDGHVIVRINSLVLPSPVLFVGERHGPKAPGPAWAEIKLDATLHIVADAIVANPAFRDYLLDLACDQAAADRERAG